MLYFCRQYQFWSLKLLAGSPCCSYAFCCVVDRTVDCSLYEILGSVGADDVHYRISTHGTLLQLHSTFVAHNNMSTWIENNVYDTVEADFAVIIGSLVLTSL